MAITQIISNLPTAPDPATMTPAEFSTAAAASVLAQKAMVPEINTWTSQVNAIVSGAAGDIASGINGATAKTTPVDADLMTLTDSAASFVLKKLTWANLKTTLGSTFAALAGSSSQAFDVAADTVSTRAARNDQLQLQSVTAFTTGGTSTAYTLTPVPAIGSLVAGQRFRIKFHVASGAAPTLAVSGMTATSLKMYGSSGSTGGAGAKVFAVLSLNQLVDVEYDGTDFVIMDNNVVKPAFYTGGSPTHSAGSNPIIFGTVGLDSTSAYNTSDGKYTPKVAGYYLFIAQAFFAENDGTRFDTAIWKNGSAEVTGFQLGFTAGGGNIASTSCVTYMNGTTDYVQAWSTSTAAINSTNNLTHFSGSLL